MKIKKIKSELILGMIVGIAIITLTAYYSIPKKSLMPKIDLIVYKTPEPLTEWRTYDAKDFGLNFEYHNSWNEPELRSNALERIIYIGSIVITKKSIDLEDHINSLKKQKIKLQEATISGAMAYTYEQENNSKIVIENIVLSKDKDEETTYEVSYSYSKPEDKEKIDKFIQSIKIK